MKPAAWIVVAVAAMVAAVAWRFARRSKLALAIAVVATSLAALGLTFAAGGWGGCKARGDCGPVGGALRTVLGIETLLLPVLLLAAGVRALWRRLVPKRAPRARRPRSRMRPRDIGLALTGLAFGAISLIMVIGGQGADRMAGVGCLLFSGALLIVPLSGRLAARSGAGPSIDRYGSEPALVISGSRLKVRLMRVGMLCFAGFGLVLTVWPEGFDRGGARAVGVLCLVTFGGMGLVSAVLTRGPWRIELLPTGLRWRLGTKPCFVRWEAITAVWPFAIYNSYYLGIDGDVEVPRGQRRLARLNRSIAHADASITLEAFPVDPERLAEVVAMCARDARRRREIGTDSSLRWFEDGVPEPEAPLPVG